MLNLIITNKCIACDLCRLECPSNAIAGGDPIYLLNTNSCNNCIGFHDELYCVYVCPVDAIITKD